MSRTKNHLLCIGLPVFNGQDYIAETIESLLGQSFGDFQLIIADNASTDNTIEICERYASHDARVRLLKSDINKGAAWNFNRTVYQSQSKYFKWAAHDDLHAPEFLSRCIDVLEGDEKVVLAFTRTHFIDGSGSDLGEYKFPVDLETATKRDLFLIYANGGHIVHEVFGVMRRDALENTPLIGGYVGSDLIMLGRLALTGRFVQVPSVLFFHREHAKRSTVATGGNQGFTHWYDSSKTGRLAMPRWKRLYESMKSVAGQPMKLSDRFAHFYDIGRGVNWGRRDFAEDLIGLFRKPKKRG